MSVSGPSSSQPALGQECGSVDTQPRPSDAVSQQLSSLCYHCSKPIRTKSSLAIKCVACGIKFHVGCLVTAFIAINGGTFKSSYQWLAEFLQIENFYYLRTKLPSVLVLA